MKHQFVFFNVKISIATLLFCAGNSVLGQDSVEYHFVAPTYPGAVTSFDAPVSDSCRESLATKCTYYTDDPIDKVLSFYKDIFEADRFVLQERLDPGYLNMRHRYRYNFYEPRRVTYFAPRAYRSAEPEKVEEYVEPEGNEYFEFFGVLVQSSTPLNWVDSAQQLAGMINDTLYLKNLYDGVDWTNGADPKRRGLRNITEFKPVFEKYKSIEGGYFHFAPSPINIVSLDAYSSENQKKFADLMILHARENRALQAKIKNELFNGATYFPSGSSSYPYLRQTLANMPGTAANRKALLEEAQRHPYLWSKIKNDLKVAEAAQAQGDYKLAQEKFQSIEIVLHQDSHMWSVVMWQTNTHARSKPQFTYAKEDLFDDIEFTLLTDAQKTEVRELEAKQNRELSDLLWNTWIPYFDELSKFQTRGVTKITIDSARIGSGSEGMRRGREITFSDNGDSAFDYYLSCIHNCDGTPEDM